MDAVGGESRLGDRRGAGACTSPTGYSGDDAPGHPVADDVEAERLDVGEPPSSRSRKRSLQADRLHSNLDVFASQLASIRAKVAARTLAVTSGASPSVRLPLIDSSPTSGGSTSPIHPVSGSDHLRLPLLRRIDHATQQNQPPRDLFVVVDNISRRETQHEQFRGDWSALTTKEQAAAAAIHEADRLDEQARVAAVAFAKHERNWPFDERTRRHRELLELRKLAEDARIAADRERATAQHFRSQLHDPYRSLKTATSSPRPPLAPITGEECMLLWVLASPLPSLPFTPREETLQGTIEGEKELSTHVVYYIAPSSYSGKSTSSPRTPGQDAARTEDRPPSSGWISCSSHGAFPLPQVTQFKSSIETWVVQGAGAGHVNGKYIVCGAHDLVRKFRASSGVELFRKRVPVMSALAQSLYDGPSTPETATTSSDTQGEIDTQDSIRGGHEPPSVLPSALRSIEKDEHSFRSMQRIGAWLGMNEERERYCRLQREDAQAIDQASTCLETEAVESEPQRPAKIKVQDERDGGSPSSSNSIAHSRQESCAPICKEWVLFLKCTKRKPLNDGDKAVLPPPKPGLGCPYRHYFISVEEKTAMTIWAQDKEYQLEKSVLAAVISREAHIKSLSRLSSECMTAYQQNLRSDTDATLVEMLTEMNHIRLWSVKVVEKIEMWRIHIRRQGFTRYDQAKDSVTVETTNPATDTSSFLLGWSATITVSTGKQLYKGSKAFVSRIKRFCRPEDPTGKKEQHIVYLGYFKTRMEAERAYDEFAATEARRLNTTTTHLPRRRGVFRSCGKHYAVESERLGPSFCIECKTQALTSSSSSTGDWTPPFYYTPGQNYVLKMADDLDFLDDIPPLKALLNNGRGRSDRDFFPLRGNALLLPRDPVYDISVLPLTYFGISEVPESSEQSKLEDVLDRDRIVKVQQVLLQELQLHHPEDIPESTTSLSTKQQLSGRQSNGTPVFRVVEALYWDRCAALQIQQKRAPLAYRQANVWCRPDAGEWSSLVTRGANQLHFIFETNLANAGREIQKKRKELLKVMRAALSTPLYLIHHRSVFTDLIVTGQALKGDVVQLEVNNLTKRLARYDAWCISSEVVQRGYRRYTGRRRATTRLRALRQACRLRVTFMNTVHTTAKTFYERQVVPVAVRRAIREISRPVYRCVVKKDDEMLVVSVHALRHYRGLRLRSGDNQIGSSSRKNLSSRCCSSCARRFRVKAMYGCERQCFSIVQAVCTCKANGGGSVGSERWLLRAYNPVNNTIYRVEIGNAMLTQLKASRQHTQRGIGGCSPVQDMESAQRLATEATILASFTGKRALQAHQELLSWKRLSSDAVQARKTAAAMLSASIETEEKTQTDWNSSVVSAKKAMNFSSRAFSEAQAWDPIENANDWRLLVDKRRLEKLLVECRQETEQCRVTCFQATYNELYTRAMVSNAQSRFDLGWLPKVNRDVRCMEAAAIEATTTRAAVGCSVRRLCRELLSLRDKGVPLRRQLVVDKPARLGAAVIHLALPELQRHRNCLRRRIVKLENDGKEDRHVAKRMVVSVYRQSRTDRSGNESVGAWWATSYDPTSCMTQEVYMEWEIVRLLVHWKPSAPHRDDTLLPRAVRQQIADVLLSIVMLDRFTGEFTLRKLLFYQQMRLVRPQIYASRWFMDLQYGRKSGRGDEVLRQGTVISGRLGVVFVFENWGDLAVEFYHSATGRSYELALPVHDVSRRLGHKPLLLRLWVSSVISNSYAPSVLKYVLKLLAIESSQEGERLRLRSDTSKSWKKCFQAARTIQGRRILVSVREDASRDFRVLAFDLNSNQSYAMDMEREVLAGIFKGRNTRAELMPLLLRQNRSRLYEWVADHLQFQNLLEHPATLATSLSPLANGLHVRQSFKMLNNWVSSRQRIPVARVPSLDIDQLAAESETKAISSILFDQLAIISDVNLPFDSNKQRVGTLEWADVCSRSRPTEAGNFMKMDVYVESHNLMVRLRRELVAEAELRRQQASRDEMETEEAHSLTVEIQETLVASQEALTTVINDLGAVRVAVDATVRHWAEIHAELARSTRVKVVQRPPTASPDEYLSSLGNGRRLEAIERMSKLVGGDLRSNPLVFDMLCSKVVSGEWVPLPEVSKLLGDCVNEMSGPATEKLRALASDFESIMADNRSLRLQRLQYLRQCTADSSRGGVGCHEPSRPGEDPMPRANSGSCVGLQHPRLRQPSGTELDRQDGIAVSTALLIPENPLDNLQEFFFDTDLLLGTKLTHSERITALTTALEPIFRDQLAPARRRFSATPDELLACHRGDGGFIVCQDGVVDARLLRNPRATAAAGQIEVHGVAVYIPFAQPSTSDCDLGHRLTLGCIAYKDLVAAVTSTSSDDPMLPGGGDMSVDKKRRIRSAKFLPWKQSASDRMRVARMFKRSVAAFGRSVVEISADVREREDATVATSSVSFRQLECLTGRVVAGLSSLEALEGVRFAVSKTNESRLDLASPLVLSGLRLKSRDCDAEPLGGDARALIDMDAVQVEVDSVDEPRRLQFSCRDLQSRRRYVVDCGYYDLRRILPTHKELGISRPTTIQAWRSLAQLAAQHLEFRRMNGTQWLGFGVDKRSECHPAISKAQDTSTVDDTSQSISLAQRSQSKYQARMYKEAVVRCCSQRFAAHQKLLLHFVAAEQARVVRNTGLARRHEWVAMILEDQRSSLLRGALVLDVKALARVRAAHKNGTQRTRRQRAKSKATGCLQLVEICKDLGLSVDAVDGVRHELEAIESDHKQRRKRQQASVANGGGTGAEDSRDKEWPLSIVAEWWRRHLVRVEEEKVAKAEAQQQQQHLQS